MPVCSWILGLLFLENVDTVAADWDFFLVILALFDSFYAFSHHELE